MPASQPGGSRHAAGTPGAAGVGRVRPEELDRSHRSRGKYAGSSAADLVAAPVKLNQVCLPGPT